MRMPKITFKQVLFVVVGAAIYGFALSMFLVPNKIAAGGVSGIATILYHLFGLPIGTMIIAINIPLFLLGWKNNGLEFIILSLTAIVVESLVVDYIPVSPMTTDPLLGSVFGGVLTGIGLGIVERGGGSDGGTFMAAKLLHRFVPQISVAYVISGVDSLVILASAFAFTPEWAMYALLSLYVATKIMDLVISGLKSARAVYIISTEERVIAQGILDDLGRGMTRLEAKGMYTGESRGTLLCIVDSGREVVKIKELVKRCDPNAFVFISDVSEVMGEGFVK